MVRAVSSVVNSRRASSSAPLKRITLEEPIKALGEFSVSMRLHNDVTAQLKVTVVRE